MRSHKLRCCALICSCSVSASVFCPQVWQRCRRASWSKQRVTNCLRLTRAHWDARRFLLHRTWRLTFTMVNMNIRYWWSIIYQTVIPTLMECIFFQSIRREFEWRDSAPEQLEQRVYMSTDNTPKLTLHLSVRYNRSKVWVDAASHADSTFSFFDSLSTRNRLLLHILYLVAVKLILMSRVHSFVTGNCFESVYMIRDL